MAVECGARQLGRRQHLRHAADSALRLLLTAQFPETLPDEVLAKMHAAPKADLPVADVHDLPNYDGFILGFPTRCGPSFWTQT